jgi:hypothetical protein
MFFDHSAPVHSTLRKLTGQLNAAAIPYAIVGGMAVNIHGAERTTRDVDVLLTADGLTRFREHCVGKGFDQVQGRPRRFVDTENQTTVDILVTGHRPGFGAPVPFSFPDPLEASEEIRGIRVLTLAQLVQLKLAARRHYDFGDVVFLIKTHNLDESFLAQLHPFVHQDFIECLEEKRRGDEYEARQTE